LAFVGTLVTCLETCRTLAPDTDLLEDVCENEIDTKHRPLATGITLSPEVLVPLAGVYELARGGEVVFTMTGDMLFAKGLNEPRLPLLATSETRFMSTANPTGFEFVKDSQGNVTHVIVPGANGDQKAARTPSKPV
jgi:hypothetical protein